MVKLKRSYSDRVGVSGTNLRFLYEGRRILDDDTPGSLEMESGDYIEVRSPAQQPTVIEEETIIQYEGLHGSRPQPSGD